MIRSRKLKGDCLATVLWLVDKSFMNQRSDGRRQPPIPIQPAPLSGSYIMDSFDNGIDFLGGGKVTRA